MRFIIVVTLIFVCSACTIIELVDKNGAVKIEHSLGFSSIGIAPDAGVVTANVVSLGYLSSPLGYSLGYSKHIITSSDESCRVIIWIDDKVDMAAMANQIKSIDPACILIKKE